MPSLSPPSSARYSLSRVNCVQLRTGHLSASDVRLLDTGADDARNDHEAKRHKDDALPMEQEPSSSSGVKRANVEAIRRG